MECGGKSQFFRVAMGLGNIHDPNPKNRVPDFDHITPFEVEMKICCEYLHCSHKQYTALPSEEKLKLLLYEEMQRKRSNDSAKKMNQKYNNKNTDTPALASGKRK